MDLWRQQFRIDPVPALLRSGNQAICYFVRRDLLDEVVGPVAELWRLPEVLKILRHQLPDGSWPRHGQAKYPAINYALIETWRWFRHLVQEYGFTRESPPAEKAAEFLFSCQTPEGDIRGFLANQYATYYSGAIMSLLVQAGYQDDPRIEKGFQWLLAMRQDDLGWTVPLITHPFDGKTRIFLTSHYAEPVEPDRSKPFSHNWTGMILRAFAAHPRYCQTGAARTAARLLASRFFQPDVYTSYQQASYWVRFDFPFWWNNLVAAMDTVTLIGLTRQDDGIQRALDWFIDHQEEGGLWKVSYVDPVKPGRETAKVRETGLWVSLAICRVCKRLSG